MIRFCKVLVFFLFSLAIFSSCKKTNAPTDGQLVAARIRAIVGDVADRAVVIYSYASGQIQFQGTIKEVGEDGQIGILVGGDTHFYNLGNLVTYSTSSTGVLLLYF